MSNGADIHDHLQAEWIRLLDAWSDAQASWNDQVALQFAKRFMSPWEIEIPSFLAALDALEQELDAAQRDTR